MGKGVRSHLMDCRICGQRYRQTNFMKRLVHPETLDIWTGPRTSAARDYRDIDTHILAHWKRGERQP